MEEEKFILVHDFRSFSALSAGSIAFGLGQGRNITVQGKKGRGKLLTSRLPKSRERKGQRGKSGGDGIWNIIRKCTPDLLPSTRPCLQTADPATNTSVDYSTNVYSTLIIQ